MVLSMINLLAVHINSGDAEKATGICRDAKLAPAIFGVVNLVGGPQPSFLDMPCRIKRLKSS